MNLLHLISAYLVLACTTAHGMDNATPDTDKDLRIKQLENSLALCQQQLQSHTAVRDELYLQLTAHTLASGIKRNDPLYITLLHATQETLRKEYDQKFHCNSIHRLHTIFEQATHDGNSQWKHNADAWNSIIKNAMHSLEAPTKVTK
jgi:hypothetical protein